MNSIFITGRADGGAAPKKVRGLGDVVERVTRAVGIKPCGGCKKRQAWLNEKVPFRQNDKIKTE